MLDSSPTRILIVDDESAQRKALCDTLRDHGYETVGFGSGKAAMVALRDTRFDLLLTDLMMPEMDGIALLRAAREVDQDLVGIMMTGAGSIGSAVDAMKAGALDYILKPFELSAILPVLSRALTIRKLRRINVELEERVRQHASNLEIANKELEAANRELEAFTYSVSHDLRAPLRAIDGFTKILLQRFTPQMPEEAQRLQQIVIQSTQEMGQLIEALLRLSRLGRQALVKQPVNISLLVSETLTELRKELGGRQVEVKVGELSDCIGDPSLLKQVFVNLLSNAFKYTRQKESAAVEVGCQQRDNEWIYWVRDNGAGFDMQYADKLFGVFQRMHRAEEYEGTGVGLSIVQRVIQRHGGRVWAEAETDKGATFYFTLPR